MPFYKIYAPPPILRELIRELQVYHVKWNEEKNLPPPFITCLANTEQNLYFLLKDPLTTVPSAKVEIPQPPVFVTGPKYKPVGLMFGKDHLMIKVVFHPTGTYRLCGIKMKPTVNSGLDAVHIWGKDVTRLLKRLRKTSSYDSMARMVSAFLVKKFDKTCRPKEPIDHVAIQMLDSSISNSLEEWASLACLSLRQFERNFITRVGLSPKLFIRIVRFEAAMRIKNTTDKNWSEIALECRYTDSSHLLKEFKQFAEFAPSHFYLKSTSGHSELATG